MRVVVTRAENEAPQMAARLSSMGITPLVAPMMEVEIIKTPVDVSLFHGFITTSGNGVRSLAEATKERDIRLFCVGGQSEKLAKELGFTNTQHSIGNHKNLTIFIGRHLKPNEGTLLYLHGDIIMGNPIQDLRAKGFKSQSRLSYTAAATKKLPEEVMAEFQKDNPPEVVTFYSIRTFRLFRDLMQSLGLIPSLSKSTAVCLSPAIADFARELRWKSVVALSENSTPAFVEAIEALKPDA